jgi:hypothetical protein
MVFALAQYMSAQIINGKAIAEQMLAQLKLRVDERIVQGARAPSLAVILVGTDPASAYAPSLMIYPPAPQKPNYLR